MDCLIPMFAFTPWAPFATYGSNGVNTCFHQLTPRTYGSHLTLPIPLKRPTNVGRFNGGSGWIRTTSGLSQQIYSLPRLSNSGARPNLFATSFLVACHTKPGRSVVRAAGIEPAFQAWKACILAFVLCPQQIQSHVIIYEFKINARINYVFFHLYN